MIELPEAVVIARQMTKELQGRRIAQAMRGNSIETAAFLGGAIYWCPQCEPRQ